jgi:hypothetical protein
MKIKINVTAIFLVVFYGVEALSLILREEHWLRLFENRVLRKIFGPKRDDVTQAWRCLHDEHLYDLYFLSDITRVIKSRRMSWAGRVIHMRDRRGA